MGIDDHRLETLLTRCAHLTCLDLGWADDSCGSLHTLNAAAAAWPRTLTDLSLAHCPYVRDAALINLGSRCPALRRIDIGGDAFDGQVGLTVVSHLSDTGEEPSPLIFCFLLHPSAFFRLPLRRW